VTTGILMLLHADGLSCLPEDTKRKTDSTGMSL
jgi:hypothetical protein